jgi:hypothetical protein
LTDLLNPLNHNAAQVACMKKKTMLLETEEEFSLDLTLHDVPASLVAEFAQKIVKPYYNGNLNAAIQDLINKAISEQDYVYSHITHIRKTA